MKLSEILTIIESFAPLQAAAAWDVSGMQVASCRDAVTHLAVVLDPTPAMLAKAVELGADMVLAHHPLLLKARLPNRRDDFAAALRTLFVHDIPLYSAHTSLDASLSGPVAWLADTLELGNRQALEPAVTPSLPGHYGFGLVGDLPGPVPYSDYITHLAQALGKSSWRASGPLPATVTRVAYCPGSGESLIAAALQAGAQVYVTGDVKYHAALEAPIRVLDVGHFVLEEIMMRSFADRLRAACAPVTVTFLASADPFVPEQAQP